MKKVTIQDIANDLNLSRNTVSKALCNDKSVSYETRQKIIKRSYDMNYLKLNPKLKEVIENLKPIRTGNIAVILLEETDDFWNQIMFGISEELRKNNYNLMFNYIKSEDEINLVLPLNISRQYIDGIIILSVLKKEYINKIIEQNIPIVFLDAPVNYNSNDLKGDVILIEGEKSVYNITKNLIDKGYKNIGFIGDITYCRTIYDRWQGFKSAMLASNLKINDSICLIKHIENRYYKNEDICNCLKKLKEMPKAFVCANDFIAFLTIKYLRENGYNVPVDIAITGFDDEKNPVIAEFKLTTVHVSNKNVGKRLVQELIWRISNPEVPYETITILSSVVFRKSTDIQVNNEII